ncbi:MAG: hypothetical protein V4692_04340, partial [Bdellovibrionota bacterium]
SVSTARRKIEMPSSENLGNLESYTLEVEFGKLTQSQFEALKLFYKSSNIPAWSETRAYGLVDFLPAPIQAVYQKNYLSNRQHLDPKHMKWAHEQVGSRDDVNWISKVTNCFSTAYEFLRNSKSEFTVFFASEANVNKIFGSRKYSDLVVRVKNDEYLDDSKFEAAISTVQPGDLVMIYMNIVEGGMIRKALAHVGVALDSEIVFEKTNTGSDYPYRVSFLKDSIENLVKDFKVPDEMFPSAGKIEIVVRRFGKKPLPHPRDAFSLSASPGVFIDPMSLAEELRPSNSVIRNHAAVADIGMGGNILFESLYEILDFDIRQDRSTGLFELSAPRR